ncbi:hypothetical protein ACFU53_12070 [Streptomyces sp. NPDC057474]|uniref:hypothetical protein n=1 Tax=Streptomyces sp. NPDC057474 TaxID=3346144 RepID=UPI0036BD224C
MTGTAEYVDKISAVFVHQTGSTNSYSCAESPALIRALMAYDIRTAGRGDLGYNFVVDKCGRVYEGRAGSMTNWVGGVRRNRPRGRASDPVRFSHRCRSAPACAAPRSALGGAWRG